VSRFIGRKRELSILQGLTQKTTASLVVIKGRRRIGKSRLIQEFSKNFKTYIFSGIPLTPATTKESQIKEFVRQMRPMFNLPDINFTDWGDVFWFLGDKLKNRRKILVLDEISWIGSKDPDFLGKLKNFWDLQLKNNDKLMLILCGSVSSWIDKNILQSTGFVGRISSTITLTELSINECNEFWGTRKESISAYEKFKLLAVTGGIPRYLEEIRPDIPAEQNIRTICFSREGYLFNEFDQIFSDVFLTRSDFYKKVLIILADGGSEPVEICKKIGRSLNSITSEYFSELLQAGFISRDYTWHIKTGEASKLSHCRLKDNYLRFYLRYIAPYKNRINEGTFNNKSITSLPGWSTIMGLQFENLVLNNRHKIWHLLGLAPDEVIWDNPFFQNRTSKYLGCQIDYLIQTKYNNLFICEIKLSSSPVRKNIIAEVEEKISKLQKPKGFSYRPVLIHVNGVNEEVCEQNYFSNIIDFSDLLVE
jgi:AAA+ ATPase superfamily predicted ATPase